MAHEHVILVSLPVTSQESFPETVPDSPRDEVAPPAEPPTELSEAAQVKRWTDLMEFNHQKL